jgi:integrase
MALSSSKVFRSIHHNGVINGGLDPTAVYQIIERIAAEAGLGKLTPHDLRRTFAKLSRQGGAPMETIQKTLGHSSIATTERYVQTGEECNAGDYFNL